MSHNICCTIYDVEKGNAGGVGILVTTHCKSELVDFENDAMYKNLYQCEKFVVIFWMNINLSKPIVRLFRWFQCLIYGLIWAMALYLVVKLCKNIILNLRTFILFCLLHAIFYGCVLAQRKSLDWQNLFKTFKGKDLVQACKTHHDVFTHVYSFIKSFYYLFFFHLYVHLCSYLFIHSFFHLWVYSFIVSAIDILSSVWTLILFLIFIFYDHPALIMVPTRNHLENLSMEEFTEDFITVDDISKNSVNH